jgi:hypothetical protein
LVDRGSPHILCSSRPKTNTNELESCPSKCPYVCYWLCFITLTELAQHPKSVRNTHSEIESTIDRSVCIWRTDECCGWVGIVLCLHTCFSIFLNHHFNVYACFLGRTINLGPNNHYNKTSCKKSSSKNNEDFEDHLGLTLLILQPMLK